MYEWQPGMKEISGFGGGYEDCCRNMVKAGMLWLDAHPNADPHFRGYQNVYGILNEDNADAKGLSEAVVQGAEGDCTGAMHQATVSACLYIKKFGWAKYVSEMSKEEE